MVQSKNKLPGFTIIEVLIVLAIAGLVMLIVFLAAPSLQRSARNNQRRNEAARLAAAYREVATDQSKAVLAASWSDNNTLGDGAVSGQAVLKTAGTSVFTYLNISPYDGTTVVYEDIPYASSYRVSSGGILIKTGSKCGAADGTPAVGSANQIAVYFSLESSTNTLVCING